MEENGRFLAGFSKRAALSFFSSCWTMGKRKGEENFSSGGGEQSEALLAAQNKENSFFFKEKG